MSVGRCRFCHRRRELCRGRVCAGCGEAYVAGRRDEREACARVVADGWADAAPEIRPDDIRRRAEYAGQDDWPEDP